MIEKLQKVSATLFIGIFCVFVYIVTTSEQSNSKSRNDYSPRFDKEFSGKALVIDGDSVKVNDGSQLRQVRLVGIDAPEYRQTCFTAKNKEYNCGQDSHKFLIKLINQKHITCYYDQKDIYDRFLAKCKIGNISINQELIKSGMALIYDYSQSDSTMKALEKTARNQKVGIWQGKFQKPKYYRKSHPRK